MKRKSVALLQAIGSVIALSRRSFQQMVCQRIQFPLCVRMLRLSEAISKKQWYPLTLKS